MGIRLTQGPAEVLRDGAPAVRSTQEVAEVLRTGAPAFRSTQEVAEVLRTGAPKIRLTQEVVEVLRSTSDAHLEVPLSVSDTVTVAPAIVHRQAAHVSVSSAVAVAPAISKTVHVTFVSLAVSHGIGVTSTVVENSALIKHVSHSVSVGQVCAGRNNVVRIGVTTVMGVGCPTAGHDDHNRQSVLDTVHVGTNPHPLTNQLGIAVADAVSVRSGFTYYVNPLKITMSTPLQVSSSFGGGSGSRKILIVEEIGVDSRVNDKRPAIVVRDYVGVNKVEAGGPANRPDHATDALIVRASIALRSTGNRQSFADRIAVAHSRVPRTPRVEVSRFSEVAVTPTIIATAPRRLSVTNAITVASLGAGHQSITRLAMADAVTVAGTIRKNITSIAVAHSVLMTPRLTAFDQAVTSRIHVTPTHRRDFDASFTESLTFVDGQVAPIRRDASLADALPISDSLTRSLTWGRAATDTIAFASGSFPKRIFLPDPVSVPVAYGGLVATYLVLQSPSGAIVLPPPLLGDGRDNVDSVTVQRSMNGRSLALRTSSLRRVLTYTFRLERAKAFELRRFLEDNLSKTLTLTTHDAEVWMVQIPEASFEIQHAGRGAGVDEFATVRLKLEGQKISG